LSYYNDLHAGTIPGTIPGTEEIVLKQFVPVVNLWDPRVWSALMDGRVTMLPGQWIKCGHTEHYARWIGVSKAGVAWVEYPRGNKGVDMAKWREKLKSFKQEYKSGNKKQNR